MSNAIVKRETTLLETLVTAEWPRALVDAVRVACCPKDIPDVEFLAFLKRCQASGLNPLIGEAHCIPRNDKHKGRVYTFQPSAEGMRARAGKFPDFVSVDGGAVYEKDFADVDQGSGKVVHRFNAAALRGTLRGAWGRVTKKDAQSTVVWLPAGSRGGDSSFWTSDHGGQLRKCAIVAALRESYPVAFGGLYIAEEMGEAEPPVSKVDAVMGTVVSSTADAPPPPAGPAVEFGPHKGQAVSTLSPEQRTACLQEGEWILANQKMGPKVRAKMEANVAVLRGDAPALPAPSVPTVVLEARPVSHAMHDPSAEPPDDVALPGEPGS